MSKCPFWSTGKKKVECYKDCPMHTNSKEEECPFQEYLTSNKLNLKNIVDDDFAYSQDDNFKFDYIGQSSNF